jgi:tetratricopeptide (TPR) repeat protein
LSGAAPAGLGDLHRRAQRSHAARDFRGCHEACLALLERAPDFADPWFLLGMIAAEHRNYPKAIELVERAARLDPSSAEYRAHLGRCLVAVQQPARALAEARVALALAPRDALTLDTIGVVLSRVGAHDEAVAPFRAAVAADAGNPSYWYNLGASLQFIGEFDEAGQAYRRALDLEPDNFRARSSLAQLVAPGEAEAVAMRERLGGPALPVDGELQLCHALARHHEERGEWSEAMALLARGKARKRATLGYDFAADRVLFEAATSAVLPACPGHDSEEPIFIVGMPRTGTTLVERILSAHPGVFAAGELTHFALALKRAAGTPSNRVLDAQTLLAGAQLDLAAVGREYVESTRPRTGHRPRFIDKMPLNFFYAAHILRALPRARVICLRRNPLDTVLSNYRQLFATSFSYYNYAYDLADTARYYVEFDRLVRRFAGTLGTRFMEVRYEDVVADLEGEARRLLDFCGLGWDPAVLEFHAQDAPVATASSVQVRKPLYRSAVGRWRRLERELAPAREILAAAGVPVGG